MTPVLILLAGLVGPQQSAVVEPPRCLRALSSLMAGAVATSADFAAAPCPHDGPSAAFHHDSAQSVSRLSRGIARDEIVPRFPEFGVDMVQPGKILRMVVVSGAAVIERRVEAMQAARPGGRLFVRSGDGQILSARYEEEP